MRKVILGTLAAALLVAAGCKVVVTPTDANGWFFASEGASSSGYFVNGPGDPPAGRGSALLAIDGTGREVIGTFNYAGTALADLSRLEYSTYQAFSNSPNETLTLQFDVDYDATDETTDYQGRLVYVPSDGGAVVPEAWQDWDTLTGGAAWYSSASGASEFRPIVGGVEQANPPCNQATACTWAQVLAEYPNARIRPEIGLFLVRAGGPSPGGFVGATDNVILEINDLVIENNFEPGDGHLAVNPSSAAGLGFAFAQETPTGSGAFVEGPNGADGAGSAELTTDATGGVALANSLFAGTRFDAINFLSYKTYQEDATPHAITLQLTADYDSTDPNTAFQGRAVFEPSQSGQAVTNEIWQTWNPLTAPSGWWQSGNAIVGGVNVGQACTQANTCSFSELLAAYPNAAIRPITGQTAGQPFGGGIWLKAGGGWAPGFTGNVDSLTVAVNVGGVNGTVTYDFEP